MIPDLGSYLKGMNLNQSHTLDAGNVRPAQDWMKILARYRKPSHSRSIFEIIITSVLFVAFWIAALLAFSISYWLTLLFCIPASAFLLRLFIIQHDCGHRAFFNSRDVNDWVGRVIGIITFTPYDVWRRKHAIHHATSGNLDKRGVGDIDTLTVGEYKAMTPWRRYIYRLYRHPFVLFVIGPAYLFLLQHRLPIGMMREGFKPWISAMATNLGIAALAAVMVWLVGWRPLLLIHLPIVLLTASIGVWLFYIQHQFEDTFWAEGHAWNHQEAALYGSSHYDLPGILPWITGNIGIHHVHHLYSRIPFYRLPQVLRDYPELADVQRVTLRESFKYAKLRLWDERNGRLVPLAQVQMA